MGHALDWTKDQGATEGHGQSASQESVSYGQSPYLEIRDTEFQRLRLKQNLDFKGWNSHAHWYLPRMFGSSNLSRGNLSRETLYTHVYIYIYIYTYISIHVCIYVYMYICIPISLSLSFYIYLSLSIYKYIYIWAQASPTLKSLGNSPWAWDLHASRFRICLSRSPLRPGFSVCGSALRDRFCQVSRRLLGDCPVDSGISALNNLYEEFTSLAETRLAQKTFNYLKIS